MSGSGRTLRVCILGVRTQEPRRYYISLNVAPAAAAAAVPGASDGIGWATQAAQPQPPARTAPCEEPSRTPEFPDGSFVLRLPQPLTSPPPSQSESQSQPRSQPRTLLRVDLCAAPGLDAAGGRGSVSVSPSASPSASLIGLGRPDPGEGGGLVVASGVVQCSEEPVARLLRGQRVVATVVLHAAPEEAGPGSGASSPGGEAFHAEVLLELTLLDASVVLPSAVPPGGALQGADADGSSEGGGAGGGGGGSGPPAVAHTDMLESLVQDCLLKQAAMARLSRQLDTSSEQLEALSCRLADSERRTRSVAEEKLRLQQLLEQEKQAWRIPQLKALTESSRLSREELIARCESALAAYGRERMRNGELVERLRQLHAEQVDTLELKKRYQQLQEAHMEQARTFTELASPGSKAVQLQTTVRTQEEIIRKLEALLEQAVLRAKKQEQQLHGMEQRQQGQQGQAQQQPPPPGTHPHQHTTAQAPHSEEGAAAAESQEDLLRLQLSESRERVRQIARELEAAQGAAQELEGEVGSLQGRLQQAAEELGAARERMGQLQKELDAARKHTVTVFKADGGVEERAAEDVEKDLERSHGRREGEGEGEAGDVAMGGEGEAARCVGGRQEELGGDGGERGESGPLGAGHPRGAGRSGTRDGGGEADGDRDRDGRAASDIGTPEFGREPGRLDTSDGGRTGGEQPGRSGTDDGPQQQRREGAGEAVAREDGTEAEPPGAAAAEEGAERRRGVEEELKAARARIRELEEQLAAAAEQQQEGGEAQGGGGSREGAPEGAGGGGESAAGQQQEEQWQQQVQQLQQEVVSLTEEKTVAQLRAEYAEGAVEAAQNELTDVTKRYARQIAELKTRLAEKEAMLSGGFGGFDQLRRGPGSDLQPPPYGAVPGPGLGPLPDGFPAPPPPGLAERPGSSRHLMQPRPSSNPVTAGEQGAGPSPSGQGRTRSSEDLAPRGRPSSGQGGWGRLLAAPNAGAPGGAAVSAFGSRPSSRIGAGGPATSALPPIKTP